MWSDKPVSGNETQRSRKPVCPTNLGEWLLIASHIGRPKASTTDAQGLHKAQCRRGKSRFYTSTTPGRGRPTSLGTTKTARLGPAIYSRPLMSPAASTTAIPMHTPVSQKHWSLTLEHIHIQPPPCPSSALSHRRARPSTEIVIEARLLSGIGAWATWGPPRRASGLGRSSGRRERIVLWGRVIFCGTVSPC